jgi:murein DD-endopeptidase MepM/ murein hydrolase activator NlpD
MAILDLNMERRALPSAETSASTQSPMRLIAFFCSIVLVAASVVVSAQPVIAQDINARIASIRSAQAGAQRTMRQLDNEIERYQAQRKAAVKERKRAERERKAIQAALVSARAVLNERNSRFARVDGQYASPNDAPAPDIYRERLKAIRKEIREAETRLDNTFSRLQAATRVVRSKKSAIQNIDGRRKAAVARRSAAEGALSSLIKQMTEIAKAKAEQQSTVELTGQSGAFSWPTTGHITQHYGCTGLSFNPPRGSCKHFHDGIDVASASGTPVRAMAVGVVAYSGWNPYDKEGRAYVVHVAHPDGFTSIYGHLLPTNHVRAGELVHTGQVIGKMGNTGKSTGTHLHFELLRNGRDVDPTTYLPTGIVVVDKTTTKSGLAEKERAIEEAKATPTPKPTPKPKPSKTLNYPTATWEEYQSFQLCPDLPKGEECDPKQLLARLDGTSSGAPGVPKPYRATSKATS